MARLTCSPNLVTMTAVAGCVFRLCLACGESTQTSSAAPDGISGELKVVVVEGEGPGTGPRFFLNRDDGQGTLPLSFDDPSQLSPNAHLLVHGFDQNGRFRVLDYEQLGSDTSTAELALTGQSLLKSRTVSFGLVDYFGRGVQNGIGDKAKSFMYSTTNAGPNLGVGTGDKSVRQYYDETSYGMFRMSEGNGPGVEGPFSYSGTAACGDQNCDTLASKLTPSLSASYDHHVWYYGTVLPECDGGYGWGSQGTWLKPEGDIWFNGDVFDGAITHEIGHNLGFQHASSITCQGVPLADDPTQCKTVEYGNTVSIMGNVGNGHMSGIEKWYAGWLLGCNGVRVKSSGTFTLFPLELACNGIQTLQVPMPKTTRKFNTDQSTGSNPLKFYYLELRTSQGLDSGQKNQIMVHASDDIKPQTSWCARNVLLDMKPSTTRTIDGMVAGDSFTDPAGGVTIEVDSLSATQATVTITLATSSGSNTCIDGSALTGSGPSSCGDAGGSTGTGGAANTGGNMGKGGAANSSAALVGGTTSTSTRISTNGGAGTGGRSSASSNAAGGTTATTRTRSTSTKGGSNAGGSNAANNGGSGVGSNNSSSADARLVGGTDAKSSSTPTSPTSSVVGGTRGSISDGAPASGGANSSTEMGAVTRGGSKSTQSTATNTPLNPDEGGVGGVGKESSTGAAATEAAAGDSGSGCGCKIVSQSTGTRGLEYGFAWWALSLLAARRRGTRSERKRLNASNS